MLMNGKARFWKGCCSRCNPKDVRRYAKHSQKRYEERNWRKENNV